MKIYAAIQQVDGAARELADAGAYSRWNTKAFCNSPTEAI